MVPSKCQFTEARGTYGTYGTYVSLVMLFISYVSGPKNHHFASPVSQLDVNLLYYICNKSHVTYQSARRGLVRGGGVVSSGGRALMADRMRLPALGAAVSRLAGAWAALLGRALSGDGDPAGLRGRLVPVAVLPLPVASGRGREVALPSRVVVRLVGGRCGTRGLLV